MNRRLRDGTLIEVDNGQERFLSKLYGTAPGRFFLKLLICPFISKAAGAFLSSGASRFLNKKFIRNNNIDMSQFEDIKYRNFNDLFSRKIRDGARTVDYTKGHFISPADSKLTVLPITEDCHFALKNTEYTVESLLCNGELAKEFIGGTVLIFRLTVDDYHRYCYTADAQKEDNVFIKGKLHTVNPIANDYYPIYKENSREYCVLHSEEFGDMVMVEVGALLVGKIVNHHGKAQVKRGEEKGYFQYGGSTVVIIVKKDAVKLDADIIQNSLEGVETVVRYGEKIGEIA
ncbi:MAG: phosphatidylserine decarboxylase [Ruminococcaceae bacterium]|nr:phosphatidylserine decarboxylase [Oscillospiraceae bacterium]